MANVARTANEWLGWLVGIRMGGKDSESKFYCENVFFPHFFVDKFFLSKMKYWWTFYHRAGRQEQLRYVPFFRTLLATLFPNHPSFKFYLVGMSLPVFYAVLGRFRFQRKLACSHSHDGIIDSFQVGIFKRGNLEYRLNIFQWVIMKFFWNVHSQCTIHINSRTWSHFQSCFF